MSVIEFSVRAAVLAAIWTSLQLCGFAQVTILPPITIPIDVCGTVIADTGCGQILETYEGALYSVDDWTDELTGIPAQIGDDVRVEGELPYALCWNACQLGVSCLFTTKVYISCLRETERFCFGDGSSIACPCGNLSPQGSGAGCLNSTGDGASLEAVGSVDVAADDLVLEAMDLPPGAPGMLVSGQSEVVVPFKDGLLCAGNPTLRVEVVLADVAGYAATTTALAGLEGLVPGDQRVYQLWYRDPVGSACGTGSNLTSALRVSWL